MYQTKRKTFFSRLCWVLVIVITVMTSCKKDDKPTPESNAVELESFTPAHAARGAVVTLKGRHFSTVKTENEVKFQGSQQAATVQAASASELRVVVPATAVTGKITVRVGNRTAESATAFTVDPDVTAITDFAPKEGPIGTTVTVSGVLFGDEVKVTLNDVEAAIKEKSATEIVFVIPSNTSLTAHKIKIVSDGTTVESAADFTVTNSGPKGEWINKHVNAAPAAIFAFGTSVVYNNKIYWGFTKMTALQDHADYMVLDPEAENLQWVLAPPPPSEMVPASMQSATATVAGGKLYFGTGLAPEAQNKWWIFNPETNEATPFTDFPENTAHAVAFSIGGQSLFAGFGTNSKNLYRYDFHFKTWFKGGIADVHDMSNASAFVINNEVFIGRGLPGVGQERRSFFRYGGGNWMLRPASPMPESVLALKTPSFDLNGKGYFVTGRSVWEFTPDPDGGTWRLALNTQQSPVIQYTAKVMVNNQLVVYGWTASGELYEFKLS